MLEILFGAVTLSAMLRLATPLILASLGGCFGEKTGIFNIALESFMLTAAFFATLGSYLTQNPWIGVMFGILAGLACAVVFGFFVFVLGSSGMVVSIALNTGAWGFTTLLLSMVFQTRGAFMHENIKSFPSINVPILNQIPYLRDILNNQNIIVYLTLIAVAVTWVVMYKTPFGLRLRSVGINAKASQTAGINILRYKWSSVLITGVFAGVAGAILPLGGTSMFSENMSAGRGFLAVAAIMIGRGNPVKAALSCLLFAYADALTIGLQNLGIPSQIVLTLPYLATIFVLFAAGIKKLRSLRVDVA